MHFYESSIITTKDGLLCQVYGNEHPVGRILVKPKYIPTTDVESSALPYRFISGRKMNRLNTWADKDALKKYVSDFKETYPSYIYSSNCHGSERLFFSIAVDNIERIYFPRRGFRELMSMPKNSLDNYLRKVYDFASFLLQSGLRIKDFGITYSTLMGHYDSDISDINLVVYGKDNFWKLMNYLNGTDHPLLRWKSDREWLEFRQRRNRSIIFSEAEFLHSMRRKKSEGFFENTLFVIFAAEKEEEVWFKWSKEKYLALGQVTVEGEVADNFSSAVRPGYYGIKDSQIINSAGTLHNMNNYPIKKIVFYSRDYCLLAEPGEKIRACGVMERVEPKMGEPYYRVVVGYFDAYLNQRREQEYVKVISGHEGKIKNDETRIDQ